jgi:MFS family permease
VAKMSAVMTEEQSIKSVRRSYARTWVLVAMGGSVFLALIGASVLFSFVHQVDWRVCAVLCVCLLLALLSLLIQERWHVWHGKRTGATGRYIETPRVETEKRA